MTARGTGTHPWVQPIIVAKTGTHLDTIGCAATASLAVWSADHSDSPFPVSNYAHWLAGPFTKTVRRASMTQMAALVRWANENKVPYADAAIAESAAVAFPPMRYEDMPKQIAHFQVSGTDLERTTDFEPPDDAHAAPGTPRLHLLVNDALTTGKASAAAAHALWAWALPFAQSDAPTTDYMAWERADRPFSLELSSEQGLHQRAGEPGAVPIIDAGLTEIAPSTMTALALTSV